ncbi:MAG: LysR family transcriptional regulator [Parvibaculum sp.]|nr:LysR family transcriptional regulator [Parvibaculum sp.]
MTKNPPSNEAPGTKSIPTWDRDELRFVLEAAATRSLNRAATHLGVSNATIGTRIAQLEDRLGYRIFDRSPRGVFLTSRGEAIVAAARNAYVALEKLEFTAANIEVPNVSHVRLSITDGIATFWIAPKVGAFHAEHAEIVLECSIGEEPADPFLAQTDLSIRMRAPDTEEFVVRPLGHLHLIPYASKDYLARHGTPRDMRELAQHPVVDHTSYRNAQGPWYTWDNAARLSGPTALRTNIGAMTVTAVEHGAGIGLLPSYVSLISDRLVPIDLNFHMRSDLILCYLRDVGDAVGKRAVANWLQDVFDPTVYPCFRAEFVHPRDFGRAGVPAPRRP